MVKAAETRRFDVEEIGESRGHCECCGNESALGEKPMRRPLAMSFGEDSYRSSQLLELGRP
jgi:hypothetical protein